MAGLKIMLRRKREYMLEVLKQKEEKKAKTTKVRLEEVFKI